MGSQRENNVTSRHEVSSQQAAATCLGHSNTTSSEGFWYCYPHSALNFFREKYPSDFLHTETYIPLNSETRTIGADVTEILDNDENEDGNDTIQS